jgi:LysR family transcriptional regulator of abg operon
MTLTQLRALLAVARAGSIQEAARLTHVSQPAVSKAIRDFELELGVPLLIRSAKGATLSPYGSVIERRAKAIMTEIDKIIEETNWLKGELGGRLIVGLAPPAAGPALASVAATFRHQNPTVELQLLEMRSPEIVENLRSNTIDIGIVTQFGEQTGSDLKWQRLYGMEMILAAGGSFATEYQKHSSVTSLAELAQREWLEVDATDDASGYLASLFRHFNLPVPKRVIRCSSTVLGYSLAALTNVVTCWNKHSFDLIEPRYSSGKMVRLTTEEPLPELVVSLVYRDEDLLTPLGRQFTRLLQSAVRSGNFHANPIALLKTLNSA